jgi:hypothetical protein
MTAESAVFKFGPLIWQRVLVQTERIPPEMTPSIKSMRYESLHHALAAIRGCQGVSLSSRAIFLASA